MMRIPPRLFALANRKRTADKLKPNEPLSPVSMIRIPSRLFAKANMKRTDDKLKLEDMFFRQHDTHPPSPVCKSKQEADGRQAKTGGYVFPSAASLLLKNPAELFIICTWLHEKQRLYARLVRLATKMKSYAI